MGGLLFLLTLTAYAGGGEEVIHDNWSLLKMAGDPTGWVHEKVLSIDKDGTVLFRTEVASHMEMKRFGQEILIETEMWSLEGESGNIIKMHQRALMSGQETLYDLETKGEEALLTVTTLGTPHESTIPWSGDQLGPMAIWRIRKEKGSEPGTKFSVKTFSFDMMKTMTVTVEVKGKEAVDLLDGEKATLLRSVATNDIMPGIKSNEWCDENYDIIKTAVNMMGITMETYRTTEKRAKQSGGAEIKADMIIETMARANVNLPNPYRLDSILYEFKVKDTDVGLPKNLADSRQTVLESDGETARVLIEAKVPAAFQKRPMTNPPAELSEYLESNAFLQCDHPGLREKALDVVGGETDAWKAACLLEHFVFEYIADKNFGTGFASAAEVFEDRCGDCSEHGVLLAALCRAAGIPARVAMGYMYLGGIFGGHMWAEVSINGEWYAIDGVMGIGRVDPTHITFTTSSLNKGGMGESFAAAVQGLGNLEITILEFRRGDKVVKVGESFKDYAIDGNVYTNTLYGISVAAPDGYEFDDYDRDFSGPDFTLVEMETDEGSDARLKALPASFAFTIESLKKELTASGGEITLELPRKVGGREGCIYMVEKKGKVDRVLALLDQDTCYVLKMRIRDEERDITAFERIVKSISFAK